jgi:hypothetical protein
MRLGITGRWSSLLVISAATIAFVAGTTCTPAQEAAATQNPPPYRGVNSRMEGVFVTPVPDAPLTAVAELQSTQLLADGSSETKKSVNHIARDSQGRIYNERREMVPESFAGTPPLVSFHIYDPTTKLNTFLDPYTHIAHQSVRMDVIPVAGIATNAPVGNAIAPVTTIVNPNRLATQEQDLGTHSMENVVVRGARKSRTIAASASGTGKPVVVTDEYWYSEELRLNMLVKHDDPRTGQQMVTITQVNRSEPPAATFQIPADYKIVDETPVHQ